MLREEVDEPWHLGQARLGWTAWLGRAKTGDADEPGKTGSKARKATSRFDDVILDPQRAEQRAAV